MSDKLLSYVASPTALSGRSISTIANNPFIFTGTTKPEPVFSWFNSNSQAAFLSKETTLVEQNVSKLKSPPSPASLYDSRGYKGMDEALFDSTSVVKILTSQVAMHMDREWRDKLFYQIDSLHDLDEWDPEDKPVQKSSFASFLKAMLQIKPTRFPGLGLSHGGNLLAAWVSGKDRLTAEFLDRDRVKWVLTRHIEGEVERSSSLTMVSRWLECLEPYHPSDWFYR